jgi:ribose transport system permease protein
MNVRQSNWLTRKLTSRGMQSVLSAALGFVILFVIFSFLSPSFRSVNNIRNLLRQIAQH